jgi:predicted dehydrogenase
MEKTFNWALVGTGGITNSFLSGLRAVSGAKIAAVVSRSEETARRFAQQYGIEKAYGDYDAMLGDASIDVIYLGTPHTTHKDYALRAFAAKKAVLCEKPVSINAGELEAMIKAARENKVFFMEALWTRFVPPLCKVREWLNAGLIGEAKMVDANFGFLSAWNPHSRLLNRALGGGALLDAGVYPLSLASMVYAAQKPADISSLLYLGETGVDEMVSATLSYGGGRFAVVKAALRTQLVNDAYIYGTDGYIHIPDFVFCHSADLVKGGRYRYHYEPEYLSNGYNYEAHEVLSCLRAGKTESELMPLEESLVIMQTMDTIRKQGNFLYPSEEE